MSLTDVQVERLASKMGIPLERVCFKDELREQPLVFNKSYFVNMDDSVTEDGEESEGTHWVCFQVNKIEDKSQAMYFDPYGQPPPLAVQDYIKNAIHVRVPYNTKDIQSLMANCCGYFCLAFLHYINRKDFGPDLYENTHSFLDLFEDLNKSADYKKNEFILRNFFRPSDPEERKARPIDLCKDLITHSDEDIKHFQRLRSINTDK